MSVSYLQAQKKNVRVTLDLSVYSDFDARQIDWQKLFQLDGDESVEAYVEDLDVEWWRYNHRGNEMCPKDTHQTHSFL